ncbi:hypothetical protein HQ585_10145 [candidate division KSB1 bacterium]|nr:hypothetical protein [candidate division KSB1 bacterium]
MSTGLKYQYISISIEIFSSVKGEQRETDLDGEIYKKARSRSMEKYGMNATQKAGSMSRLEYPII